MKKLLAFILICFASSTLVAQNLQLHYDFGKDRKYFTATWEMFKPDEYGSTFTFVDFDFNNDGNKSISTAYWEIARYVTIPGAKGLSATLQYNDGTLRVPGAGVAVPLGSIWLAGVSYPVNLGFVTLNTDVLYRRDYQSEGSDAQLTTVWDVTFFNGRLEFDGFVDVWSQKPVRLNPATGQYRRVDREIVVLTEPQLWFNIDKHLAVGGEVEISNNFIPGETSVLVCPTLAAKWSF